MQPTHRSSFVATALALASATGLAADVYDFRVVAESGDPAPGTLGGSFVGFSAVSLNASGQVAFRADSTGPLADSGFWKTAFFNPQLVQFVVGEDYPVPNSGGQHFTYFQPSLYGPHLNDAGNIGFAAPVGEGTANTGIFRSMNGVVETIALPGGPVPGLGGATFDYLSNLIAFNDDNLVVTRAAFTGPGIVEGNDTGLVLTWFGGLQVIAREGNGAPGVPGRSFGDFDFTMPLLAPNGQVLFDVPLSGLPEVSSSRWRGWPGLLGCLVKEGDPTPIGGTFGGFLPDFWTMSPSGSGAAFVESVETQVGAKRAVWHATGGGGNQLVPLAVEGGSAPIGTYQLIKRHPLDTTADGTTLFAAQIAGGGVNASNDTAIFRATPGAPASIVLREGTAAYGFGAGVVIDDLLIGSLPPDVTRTESGWTLLRAFVRGPGINNANNMGLWTTGPDNAIHFIARTGMLLTLAGEPARLVETLRPYFGAGQHSGRRSSINERGDVGLAIGFTNGDQALVVAQLPDACPGDLNEDGVVDAADLGVLLGSWGVFGQVGTGGDVDRDGDTDGADLAALLGGWGPCGR
jgi:hypothetical protein